MRNQTRISEVVETVEKELRQAFRTICRAIKILFSEVIKFAKLVYLEIKKAEKKRAKSKARASERSNWRINWDMRQSSQVHCKRPAFVIRKII